VVLDELEDVDVGQTQSTAPAVRALAAPQLAGVDPARDRVVVDAEALHQPAFGVALSQRVAQIEVLDLHDDGRGRAAELLRDPERRARPQVLSK
jgi:hypothetical protein